MTENEILRKAAIKAVARLEAFIENEKLSTSAKKKLESITDDLNSGIEGPGKETES